MIPKIRIRCRCLSIVALGLTLLWAGAGCLVGSRSSQTSSGVRVAQSTFEQIEPGVTTAAWVKATLGEPTSITKADDGTEIWKWSYSEQRTSCGHIFLIFSGSSTKATSGHAFVEFKDGVVVRKWRA